MQDVSEKDVGVLFGHPVIVGRYGDPSLVIQESLALNWCYIVAGANTYKQVDASVSFYTYLFSRLNFAYFVRDAFLIKCLKLLSDMYDCL